MVRSVRPADLDAVADIWLDTNIKAHSFISRNYWRDNLEAVRGMLREAELYVYEDAGEIQGFAGLEGDYIAGIFVRSGAQSGGIGRQLLDHVKASREHLTLSVYQKNVRAVNFYQREGFAVRRTSVDKNTGESEYLMGWEK